MAPEREKLVSGPGAGKPDSDFDRQALARGIEDELEEHGPDRKLAKKIAKDHLTLNPRAYTAKKKGKTMSKGMLDDLGDLVKSAEAEADLIKAEQLGLAGIGGTGKKGEGSRGGKIVGHTKAGKAIYASEKELASHRDMQERHQMAADEHAEVAGKLQDASGFTAQSQRLVHHRAAKAHQEAADAHHTAIMAHEAGEYSEKLKTRANRASGHAGVESRNAGGIPGPSKHVAHHLNEAKKHDAAATVEGQRKSTQFKHEMAAELHRTAAAQYKEGSFSAAKRTGDVAEQHAREAHELHTYDEPERPGDGAMQYEWGHRFHGRMTSYHADQEADAHARGDTESAAKHQEAKRAHYAAELTHGAHHFGPGPRPTSDERPQATAKADKATEMTKMHKSRTAGDDDLMEKSLLKCESSYGETKRANLEWAGSFWGTSLYLQALELIKERATVEQELEGLKGKQKEWRELDQLPGDKRRKIEEQQDKERTQVRNRLSEVEKKCIALERKLVDAKIEDAKKPTALGKSRTVASEPGKKQQKRSCKSCDKEAPTLIKSLRDRFRQLSQAAPEAWSEPLIAGQLVLDTAADEQLSKAIGSASQVVIGHADPTIPELPMEPAHQPADVQFPTGTVDRHNLDANGGLQEWWEELNLGRPEVVVPPFVDGQYQIEETDPMVLEHQQREAVRNRRLQS